MDTNTLLIVAAAILFMRMRQPAPVQYVGQRTTTSTTPTTTPTTTTPTTTTTNDKKDDKKDDDQPPWAKQANAAIGVATGLVGLGAKIAGELGKYVK